MIEPFGACGGVDVIARAVSQKLFQLWVQPVTVENHPRHGKHGSSRACREITGRRLHIAREQQRPGLQRRFAKEPAL